jgi:SH3-like domain-containing protein
VLEAEAFDIRKISAFLAQPRKGSSSTLASQAGSEQVRSIAAIEQPQPSATSLGAGTLGSVGNVAVNLRAEPSKNGTRLATLAPGHPIRVVDWSGGWAQVVTASGQTGWVYVKYLSGGRGAGRGATECGHGGY